MRNKSKIFKEGNKQSGITLVALAVTIVVLLILSGISIKLIFDNNGIIRQSKEAKNMYEEDQVNAESRMDELAKYIRTKTRDTGKDKLLVLEENEDNIKVKMIRDGTNKYQFSLDGINWSEKQSENEYIFKNLTKIVVNKDNYKSTTGTEYKVYSKVTDEYGDEAVYGPIDAKTVVVVEADSKYLEYEEIGGEIVITGILYNQDYQIDSVTNMENMLSSTEKILIPSYIEGKPVTRISDKLINEMTTTLNEKDENVHVWATYNKEDKFYYINIKVDKETGAPTLQMVYPSKTTKIDFYFLYGNSYKIVKDFTSSSDATMQGDFTIRSYELIVPPSVKEYVYNTNVSMIQQTNSLIENNGNIKYLLNLDIGKEKIVFKDFLNFNNVNRSEYVKLTFLGKNNLSSILNNSRLNKVIEESNNSEIEFIK